MNQTPAYSSLVPAPQQTQRARQDVLDLSKLAAALWRGKFLILMMVIVTVALGVYYAYLVATPLYRSTAVVVLNSREEQVVDIESVIGGLLADASVVNTEVEVLKSRSLLGKLVTQLELAGDPEFNRFLRADSLYDTAKLQTKRFLGLTQPAPPLSESATTEKYHEAAIDGLLNRMTIRNVPQSLVFQVTAETGSAQKSALVANTLVELYILNQLEVKFDATEQATSWLTGRVGELQITLEEAESAVKAFGTETDLINADTLAALDIQLKDIRDRISDTELSGQIANDRLQALARAPTRDAQADLLSDAQLNRLLPRVSEARVANAFDTRVSQLEARAASDVSRATAQLETLRTSQAELEAQIASQSEDLITLQQLTREAEASRLLYEYFLARLKETSAQQGIQQADSRVLSRAVVPILPASPQRALILALCAVLGAVLGALLVLLREARSDTYRTAQQLEEATGYPVMGQITKLPARKRQDAISYLTEKPTSAAAEAVRNLRTSVLLSDLDHPPQVILNSSSVPGEGKTTVSFALAQNLSAMGKKVLLVEGDIRRRVFNEYFSAQHGPGLLTVMSGKSTLGEAVVRDERTGADVLLGGQADVNAADLFSSDVFADLVKTMRGSYDQIIIDTPPVLVVPDARIIAQHVDAVLFVVKWDATRKMQVGQALGMFESVNQKIHGMVLNQINPRGMRRYGYQNEYGAYGAHGRQYYIN